MRLKRCIAFALAAILGHLNVARADAACVEYTEHTGHTEHTEHTGHTEHTEHAEHAEQEVPGASEHKECDAPELPSCCEALTSCATGGELTGGMNAGLDDLAAARALARLVPAPHLPTAPPEPPPPRV